MKRGPPVDRRQEDVMKLRIALLLVLMVAFFSGSASAQVNGGAKGGIGIASISAEDQEFEDIFSDVRTGVIVGGFVDIPVSDMFSLVIEGLYSQKGAKGTFSDNGLSVDSTVKVDYVEIPILANFPFNRKTKVHPFVYGGVAPAFRTSAKSVATFEGEEIQQDDLDDEVESMDLGLVFGGGVRLGRLAIEARYNLGVMNINSAGDEGSINTRQIAILGSFYFR